MTLKPFVSLETGVSGILFKVGFTSVRNVTYNSS